MKKGIVLAMVLFPLSTFASMTNDMAVSQQVLGVGLTVMCSVGNNFISYDSDGNVIDGAYPCTDDVYTSGVTTDGYTQGLGVPAVITWVECNSAVEGSVCDSSLQTLEDAMNDPGFVSLLNFEWIAE